MMYSKQKFRMGGAIAVIAMLTFLFTCSETPDYCGPGRQLNKHTEFCFENEVYQKCRGSEFNPTEQFCYNNNTLHARCNGGDYNPLRDFCFADVIYDRCAGRDFNPTTHGCVNNVLKRRCGSNFYDHVIEFCHAGNRVYNLCNGQVFNPAIGCDGVIRLPRCGDVEFDPADKFCINNIIHDRCGGNEYNPATHGCDDGVVKARCWGQFYNEDTHFCFGNTIREKCGGNVFNPVTQECVGGAVRAREGVAPSYILTTNTNPTIGGTVTRAPDAESYTPGTRVVVTATAAEGYVFGGWSGASTSTNVSTTITMDNNKILVAHFNREGIVTHTLTVNIEPAGAGTVSRTPNLPGYANMTDVTLNISSTTPGFAFRRWLVETPTGIQIREGREILITMNRDRVVTAVFEEQEQIDIDIDMVFVQGGTFEMGCTEDRGFECFVGGMGRTNGLITLSDFYIGRYPVTQGQWVAVMGYLPSFRWEAAIGDNVPIVHVSWIDVQEFVGKLNEMTGKSYRLPTEAEWEYAARGGQESRGYMYSGSNDADEVAWHNGNRPREDGVVLDGPYPVGGKRANELGIFDMSGNVFEWVYDWWGDYTDTPKNNPTGPTTDSSPGSSRVYRGGSWYDGATGCQITYRRHGIPDNAHGIGFRLAVSP